MQIESVHSVGLELVRIAVKQTLGVGDVASKLVEVELLLEEDRDQGLVLLEVKHDLERVLQQQDPFLASLLDMLEPLPVYLPRANELRRAPPAPLLALALRAQMQQLHLALPQTEGVGAAVVREHPTETAAQRKRLALGLACRNRILHLNINTVKRQMSLNRELAADKSLYLKLFFTNYFERKHTIQTISEFSNGIRVIDSLVQQFERDRNITSAPRASKQQMHPIGSVGQIEAEEKHINLLLQDLYNRLSHIFEKMRTQGQTESLFGDKVQRMEQAVQDDQLYEILNKYKNDYKRERDQRTKTEKELTKLREAYELCRADKDRALQKARTADKAIDTFKKTNLALQDTIATLKTQIEQLTHQKQQLIIKLEDYLQLESSYDQLTKEYELLELKYEQSQQKAILLQQKFKNLDAVVKAKIEQSAPKWTQLVEEKLSQKDIFNLPACKAFKQFVSSFNKQNKGPNPQ